MASMDYPAACRENGCCLLGERQRERSAEEGDAEDEPGDVVADVPAVQAAQGSPGRAEQPGRRAQPPSARYEQGDSRGACRAQQAEGRVEVGVRRGGVGGGGREPRRRYPIENGPPVGWPVDEAFRRRPEGL